MKLSGWCCRAPAGPAPQHMPSPRGRHGRPGPGNSVGGALSSTESPGGGGGALSSGGGAADGAPPRMARADVETPPSPVEVGPSSSPRELASRPSWLVDPDGGMVLHLPSRHRNPLLEVPPGSNLAISRDLSLSRGHPSWCAWKTSACPEKPASSPVDMLLLVVCRVGGCGVR